MEYSDLTESQKRDAMTAVMTKVDEIYDTLAMVVGTTAGAPEMHHVIGGNPTESKLFIKEALKFADTHAGAIKAFSHKDFPKK